MGTAGEPRCRRTGTAVAAGVTLRFERGRAMLERVAAECRAARLSEEAVTGVARELEQSLAWRERSIDDDHDARYLHTARTIRILVADAACDDAVLLRAAARLDTVDRALEPEAATSREVGDVLALVPAGDEETLAEALLTAPERVAVLAVAERLDQARHLHLRPELDWAAFHEQVERVYAPVGMRVAPKLGLRLDRWAEAFRRRLLRR